VGRIVDQPGRGRELGRYRLKTSMNKTPVAGNAAPGFELPDSTGKPRRLAEFVSKGTLVLLFYRGHW